MLKIAIIGAGIAGLTAARALKDKAEVVVFEKSRGVGGRVATRHASSYRFNHGAQYLTVRSKKFRAFLHPLIESGVLQDWKPKVVTLKEGEKPSSREWFEAHYVARPHMNALGKKMSEGLNISLNTEITQIEMLTGRWQLRCAEGRVRGPFDWVISAVPAPQAMALLPPSFSDYSFLRQVKMLGCFTLMVGLDFAWPFQWRAARVHDPILSWISVHETAGRKETRTSVLVNSTNEWAEQNLKALPVKVEEAMLARLKALVPKVFEKPTHRKLHRWHYAETETPAGPACLIDTRHHLGACGDWCLGDRVEAAYLSGTAIAERILSHSSSVA